MGGVGRMVPDYPSYRRDGARADYKSIIYNLVKKIIAKKGVRALTDQNTFWEIAEEELPDNKKLKLYMKLAFDEKAVDKMIAAAKEDEETQTDLISELADEISTEYGIDENFIEKILSGFIEALSRASISVRGKNTCSQLKELRRLFALTNGIKYEEEDCTYEGPCEGTCPYCDAKTKELLRKAEKLQNVKYPQIDIDLEEYEKMDEIDDFEEGSLDFMEEDMLEDDDCMEESDDSGIAMCGEL